VSWEGELRYTQLLHSACASHPCALMMECT